MTAESRPIWIQETHLNATEGYGYGESPVYETYADDPGTLFRDLQREYGRCTGRVYVDRPDGPLAVGWVFQKRVPYEDTRELYLRETWITLHSAPDTVTRTPHYWAEEKP